MSQDMSGNTPEELLVAALDLSVADRHYLAIRLLESIPLADRQMTVEGSIYFQNLDHRVADLKKVHRAEDSWQDG